MKIALAQLNYTIGDFAYNTKKIIDHIIKAKNEGSDLVVFAELAVCGYPPRDFLEFEEFIDLCEQSAQEIAKHTFGIACIIGLPVKNDQVAGKDLYNAAYFIEEGNVKTLLKRHYCLTMMYLMNVATLNRQ